MNTLGWVGSVLLALCAVPELYIAYKTKDSKLSWTFLGMWGGGELLVAIPVCFQIKEPFLMVNYLLNVVFIAIICLYKYRGKGKN
jgi:uncharacterized protein with PQ loop repeat